MKDVFDQIPGPLRKVILMRLTASGAAFLMLICILIFHGEWKYAVPCIAVAIVFFIAGVQMLADCSEKKYITIKGICSEVERTGMRKRIKSICMKQGDLAVKLPHPELYSKSLNAGDHLVVYVAIGAPVYEVDGYHVICSTLAIGKVP